MKVIGLIGYSGSGKTHFICKVIKYLKEILNMNVAVIKNIHEHQIDEEGKDSYKYSQAGALFSITKNVFYETVIFIKEKMQIEQLIEWISFSPFRIDLIFIEGFRNRKYPTILCVKSIEEVNEQLGGNIKMISGMICKKNEFSLDHVNELPIIDIDKDFHKFKSLFNIENPV